MKLEYHPRSGRETRTFKATDYHCYEFDRNVIVRDDHPWRPFRTRADFEAAELALKTSMNKEETETLFNLLNRTASSRDVFTLDTYKDATDMWDLASSKRTGEQISVPYDKKEWKFDVHYRPLWDWALDLLNNEQLSPQFEWDAQRLYRFDGNSYNSPKLPDNAKLLAFVLYADKTKLSSFGTAKGYPVIARCANLPSQTRNGNVIDKDKTSFANFKNVVWHESLHKILQSVAKHASDGYWHKGVDGVIRLLFTIILILSADYEEQIEGNFPCPICLVPQEMQHDLTRTYPLRSAKDTQKIIQHADELPFGYLKEDLLKSQGLRYIKNAFWLMKHSDINKALSFDRLHAYAGLFDDHLWAEAKFRINNLGRPAAERVDNQAKEMPRWRGLNHFDQIMNISFTDGTKIEDISKISLFVIHNVLDEKSDPAGYLLLKCIRSYSELNMYAAMELHRADIIAAGRKELLKFDSLLKAYKDAAEDSEKASWNFPKAHSHRHLFDDIEAKGVTANTTTKYNEKMHGPLKKAYLWRTNFKDVATQILDVDHAFLVAAVIRQNIDDQDHLLHQKQYCDDDDTEIAPPQLDEPHSSVWAKREHIQYQKLEESHSDDPAFFQFRIRFNKFLNEFLVAHQIPLPGGKLVQFRKDDTVLEFQALRINYQSEVTWQQNVDLLRCNPMFYGFPRYDCAIVQTTNGHIFAQLVFLFQCTLDTNMYSFALIHPFDAPIGPRLRRDVDLGFYRLREKPRRAAEFISVRSIIRGALTVKDFAHMGSRLVVDLVDTDMFLRLKKIYPML
ncbi:hypothetical protein BJV74DRAFT_878709 [Russula compacta]|nr:hypothetical protein BJV74DRAFT_878709 [Russula compacta]